LADSPDAKARIIGLFRTKKMSDVEKVLAGRILCWLIRHPERVEMVSKVISREAKAERIVKNLSFIPTCVFLL
jgi:hypothetical protein